MRIFFSGIGGVGIGPLAMLALDAGHFVVGTDMQESEMTKELKARGALVYITSDDGFIKDQHQKVPIDWYVYSSALSQDHPELQFASKANIKSSKRAEFLNFLLQEKHLKLIAISGTHGKTTTTGMLVWLFKQLGVPISYSIGTTISFGPAAQYQEGSEYFVYECDEFDKNFLHFSPHVSAIVSLDYDHADTYPTQEDYLNAFKEFVGKSEHTVLWEDAARRLSLVNINTVSVLNSKEELLSQITLPGLHTRQNALLAVVVMNRLFSETPIEQLIKIIGSFPGTNRRFEKLAENIYTDYAHHPVEIKATIEMAKELSPEVVVVYQPHQNIRQHEIIQQGGYKDCFDGAKKIYWLPTYLSREYQDLPIVSAQTLSESVDNNMVVEVSEMRNQLLKSLRAHAKSGELVIAMSAGSLDSWMRANLKSLTA